MSGAAVVPRLERKVRLRPDIEWSQLIHAVAPTWVARDPLALEYYHFSELEKRAADLFDGRRTSAEVIQSLRNRTITLEWLAQLIVKLDSACLTVPSSISTGQRLWQIAKRRQQAQRRQLFFAPLTTRIRLFDPTRLLDLLEPISQFVFSRLFVCGWMLVAFAVLYMVSLRLVESPDALGLRSLNASQALLMLFLYIAVKSLHELGHALACKRWRAECHEVGVLFLVMTPCLYCDTSDSWKLPNRWMRAGIAAAGIYVELMLATLAGVLWLGSVPGSGLQAVTGNIMLICSLSTVLVNGNPLLRYDGYYVLSDLWQVPNLHEQSSESLRAVLDSWLLGEPLSRDRWDANPYALASFGAVAWVYRQFVTLTIGWLIWSIASNSGIPLLGGLLCAVMLGSAAYVQFRTLAQWFVHILRRRAAMRWWRLAPVLGLLGGAIWFVTQFPLSTFARSRAIATHAALVPIYAGHTGLLTDVVPSGQAVLAGEIVIRLESHELDLELIETRGQLAELEQRSEQLRTRLVDEEELAAELATVLEQLNKVRERLAILQLQADDLLVRSPVDGIVLSTARQAVETLVEARGTQPPLDWMNIQQQHRLIERGTLLGWLSPQSDLEVTAYVPEATAELLRPEMLVRVRWDCQPESYVRGIVRRVSTEPLTQVPPTLVGDPEMEVKAGPSGKIEPLHPHYEVELELAELPPQISHQSLATVHFETAPRTIFQSIQRLFDQQLRPQL